MSMLCDSVETRSDRGIQDGSAHGYQSAISWRHERLEQAAAEADGDRDPERNRKPGGASLPC